MAFLAWLILAAGGVLGYSAFRGLSPAEVTRAIIRGEPLPEPKYVIDAGPGSGDFFKAPEDWLTPDGGGGSAQFGGTFIRPVPGRVVSPYGMRWGKLHNGVDLAGATGTPIKAAAAGLVSRAGWIGGFGNAVYITHGKGFLTRYGHMSKIAARVGQPVQQGQVIGYVGSTGRSSGPHLHFEIHVNGKSTDPMKYLGGTGIAT